MEVLAEEVSLLLKRESIFLMGIQSAFNALKNLNDFLVVADPNSIENLMSQFVESLLDQTESEQVAGFLEEDCLLNMSKILQEPRIIDFLARAGRQLSETRIESTVEDKDEDEDEDEAISMRDNQKLVYSFFDEYADSSAKDVVALLSPGSISKIYINTRLQYEIAPRNNFDSCYWVDSLGSYKIGKLFEIMDSRIDRDLRVDKLIDKLIGQFDQRNRYMFVFDEVCDGEFWSLVRQALHVKDERDWLIASLVSDKVINAFEDGSFDQFRKLGPLPETQSWELFCSIAFRDEPEGRCPPELEALSHEIVGKCNGFSLPIVGLAGLLSKREKKALEWQKVCNSFKLEVKTNRLHVPSGLEASNLDHFQDFPDRLRPCYLYFSVFPRNSVIPNDKMLNLWIAEGFVEEKIGKTLEEIAEEYLNELVDRGLVQPCQGFDRLERFCKARSVKPSLSLFDTDGLMFCNKVVNDFDFVTFRESRRLSIYSDEGVHPDNFDPYVQSLFVFGGYRDILFMIRLMRQCELLTVLNFEYYPIEYVPEELGNLMYLKYLSLKGTKLRELPKSVDKLVNLQTFDLRDTLLLELPSSINNLKNLQHLLASFFDDGVSGDPSRGVKVKKGIGSLQSLQTLTMVDADRSGTTIIKELAALRQLRTLFVSGLTVKTTSALCARLDKLSLLKSLTLKATRGDEVLSVQGISSQLPVLQRLVLKGRFQNLPHWTFQLRNLTTLCLNLTRLSEGNLMLLSLLPNLVSLWLCRVYKGEKLYFNEGCFEKLKLLVLREFPDLNTLEIEEGSLPCLEELRIGSSPLLSEVPSGIQYLKNLKLLINYDMEKEFVVRMQPDGGSDYWKVEHVPSVFFLCRVEGRRYKIFELGDSELLDHLHGLATNEHHITEPQNEHEFSFYEGGDEEEDDDYVGQLRSSKSHSKFSRINFKKMSFSSSFFTDDLEE